LKGCFVVVVVLVGRGGGVVVVGGGVLLLMFPNRSFQLTRGHKGSPTIVVSAKLELCSAPPPPAAPEPGTAGGWVFGVRGSPFAGHLRRRRGAAIKARQRHEVLRAPIAKDTLRLPPASAEVYPAMHPP
jgi:hypothetical protein